MSSSGASPKKRPKEGRSSSSSRARLRGQIDAFLLTLPLGTSARDAAVEDRVGRCMLQLLERQQALQAKLDDWQALVGSVKAV